MKKRAYHRPWSGGHANAAGMLLEGRSRFDLGLEGRAFTTAHTPTHHQRVGLKRLTADILGVDLLKSRRLSLESVSADGRTARARDAWAGAAICARLAKAKPGAFATPALVQHLHHQPSLQQVVQGREQRKRAGGASFRSLLLPPHYQRLSKAPRQTPPSKDKLRGPPSRLQPVIAMSSLLEEAFLNPPPRKAQPLVQRLEMFVHHQKDNGAMVAKSGDQFVFQPVPAFLSRRADVDHHQHHDGIKTRRLCLNATTTA